MPRGKIKRGRRAQAKDDHSKRKVEDDGIRDSVSQKRRRVEYDDAPWSEDEEARVGQDEETIEQDGYFDERPFYGLLDEQEQEYFKRTENLLELNQFDDPEERKLFVENVYREAEGKELKLACSQSCSRLMERLIMLSDPDQLKHLFQQFNDNFLHLVQHRFASHCCETLFIKSAPIVTTEILTPPSSNGITHDGGDPFVSMENLFLYALNELSGNLGFLMTDKFASHAFRVLLTIFSGDPLTSETSISHNGRKKKHADDAIQVEKAHKLKLDESRIVPESFNSAMRKMIEESVVGLEPHYLQTLATHTNGSPVLQKLVQHEMTHYKKQAVTDENSVIRRLLPDAPHFADTESATFINGMLYDPVGSRLLEVIVTHCPGKLFKAMWRDLFKDRFGQLARNEIAGYVMSTMLDRLSRDDLEVAHDAMLEQIPSLATRGRTAIIRKLVERCRARGIDTKRLQQTIQSCWLEDDGKTFSVCRMLDIPSHLTNSKTGPSAGPLKHHSSLPSRTSAAGEEPPTTRSAPPITQPKPPSSRRSSAPPDQTDSASILHRSLLAQAMLTDPGPLSEMLFTALSTLSSAVCLHIATTSLLSPILQHSLTTPHAPLIYRRKLIKRFYSHIGALSLDASGSHLVDSIWRGTQGMAFVRERVAEELAENERSIRESGYGRKVWRNWRMDLYCRRRGQWVREVRDSVGNEGFQSFPDGRQGGEGGSSRGSSVRPGSSRSNGVGSGHRFGGPNSGGQNEKPKTALDRARERHAQKKAAQQGGQPQHKHRAAPEMSGANREVLGHGWR